jgi:peptide deformylase
LHERKFRGATTPKENKNMNTKKVLLALAATSLLTFGAVTPGYAADPPAPADEGVTDQPSDPYATVPGEGTADPADGTTDPGAAGADQGADQGAGDSGAEAAGSEGGDAPADGNDARLMLISAARAHVSALGLPVCRPGPWPVPCGVAIDRTAVLSYFSTMARLPIVTLPDPILRKLSRPVEQIDDTLRRLADDMLETMYAAPGVGLAAIQVGVPRRLVVLDVADDDEEPQPLVLVNPEIVSLGAETRLHEEGCLSIPDVRVEIERPASLTLRYLDRHGETRELTAEGLLATAIQHEVDHLNGKLIIDFLSRLKRDIIVRRFKKQARTGERVTSRRV